MSYLKKKCQRSNLKKLQKALKRSREDQKLFPDFDDINWRTYKGEAGDLQTMLIGEYNGISFSELYDDNSFLDLSEKRAIRKIVKAVQLLHSKHWKD